jgi:sec-independent protein translocase protein TatA
MFGLGTTELLILAAVVFLLFGTRLPKVMRSLGEGVVEFKKGMQGIEDSSKSTANKIEEQPSTPQDKEA